MFQNALPWKVHVVGSGAFFFARRPERALLSDVNADLVMTYEAVRDDVQSVSKG